MISESAWPMVPIEDLARDTQYGTSVKSNDAGRGCPVLRMGNITYDGHVDTTDTKWVELPAGEVAKLRLQQGDLLFNRTNSRELVGKTAVWRGPANFTFAGYLIRVRFDEKRILPEWASAFLNSPAGKTMLFHAAKPSINMANISASELLRLRVPVPPLTHQMKSLERLALADAVRRKRKEAIALTDELLRSVFLEMFGDPVTNPKGWPREPLVNLGAVTTGNTPSRANALFFGDAIEWIKHGFRARRTAPPGGNRVDPLRTP